MPAMEAMAAAPRCSRCNGSGRVGMFGYAGAGLVNWPCDACTDSSFPAAEAAEAAEAGGDDGAAEVLPARDPYDMAMMAPPSDPVDSWSILEHEGFQYATLCREWPTTAQHLGRDRQAEFLSLPAGWELALEDEDAMRVVAKHPWGCEALVVQTGVGYYTLWHWRGDAPSKCGEGYLESDAAGRFRPTQWSLACPRILIRCLAAKAPVAGSMVGPSGFAAEPRRTSGGPRAPTLSDVSSLVDINLNASVASSLSDMEMSGSFVASSDDQSAPQL